MELISALFNPCHDCHFSWGKCRINGKLRRSHATTMAAPNLPQITLRKEKGLEAICFKSFRHLMPRIEIEPARHCWH